MLQRGARVANLLAKVEAEADAEAKARARLVVLSPGDTYTMAEVAEFVAHKKARAQAEASSLRLVENMLKEGLSVEQIETRLAHVKADSESPGHSEGSSGLQPRRRLAVTPQNLVHATSCGARPRSTRYSQSGLGAPGKLQGTYHHEPHRGDNEPGIGFFNPILGDLANVPALEIPMSLRTATTGLADEPPGSITDVGEAYARLRLLQESLSHYNDPNWWNKRDRLLHKAEEMIVEPMQTRSPKTLATVIGRQWEECKNGMSTILRHFLIQLRSIAIQLHGALEDDIRSTGPEDDPAHQILQGARPMYAQLVQSAETSRWVVEDCGKAANALHEIEQTRSREHKDLWLQFKSAAIKMLPPTYRPPDNVFNLLYIPLPRLTTPIPGFPDLERQHPWGKFGNDNAPAYDFDEQNPSPTEQKSGEAASSSGRNVDNARSEASVRCDVGRTPVAAFPQRTFTAPRAAAPNVSFPPHEDQPDGMPDDPEEDACSYSSSSADFEPEVQSRRFEFNSARPREGVVYVDSDDEEYSIQFRRTYGAQCKKCQRLGHTTRQHQRWDRTAPVGSL